MDAPSPAPARGPSLSHAGTRQDGGKAPGIFEFLRRFADPQYVRGGISGLTDLHLVVGEPPIYRFDGELHRVPGAEPVTQRSIEDMVFPLIAPALAEKLRSGVVEDVDAGFEWKEQNLSFRLNIFRDRHGIACAFRVLPKAIPAVKSLGFPTDHVWEEIVQLEQGLVIVTGITGSGKSTTVASLIEHINQSQNVRIITLEDPIEYILQSRRAVISQREIGRHVPSFHSGLRSALREDPDIIFVGEIRDPETAALALTAAETGHFVLSTLHTKDSVGVLSRIVDLFPPERAKELCTQLSFSLSQVIAQKLVPRADGQGRRAVMEVFKNLPSVANLIRTGNWHQIYSQMQVQRKEGLMTLERHLEMLVESGEITLETATRYSNRPPRANEG